MKIAIATEDETTISSHFGTAPLYVVLTIADGQVAARETRSKAVCGCHSHDHDHEDDHHHEQTADPDTPDGHSGHIDPIQDCEFVFAGGMCQGMFDDLYRSPVQPFLTSEKDIEAAVVAYLAGTLTAEPGLVG